MKSFNVPIPIFEYRKVTVVLYNSKTRKKGDKEKKKIHKKYGFDFDCDYHGLSCWKGNKHILILPNCFDMNTISHEVFHLSSNIMEYVGVKEDYTNNEAQAHLIGYLTEFICKKLGK